MGGLGSFIVPRTIYSGWGSFEKLKTLKGKKAIIVSGQGSMKKAGFIGMAEAFLGKAGIETKVFDGVEADPSLKTVMMGTEAFRSFSPDIIIGLGGCSAIDAAKMMWVFYEHPEIKFEDIIAPFTIPALRNKAQFIAIPSTSGTGTEVTCVSVITDREKGVKFPIVSYEITPDMAIVDGELASSMPKNVTANTGMDALTHSIEAFVSKLNNSYTNPLALESIDLIFSNMKMAFDNGADQEARQNMHDASCLAGMAFTNALLGINHALAHQLGGMFGIPHGCANTMLMPEVIRYNAKTAPDRYNKIALYTGLSGWEELVDKITELRDQMDMPANLKIYGISEDSFNSRLDEISKNAFGDACVGANPRDTSVDELKQIFVNISGFAKAATV